MKNDEIPFEERVRKSFSREQENSEALWASVAQEYNRGGPDAANEHLAAEKQSLLERVYRLLGELEGRING